ncbi:unannotated protein [freshwater metagenome]|uniref:Unannotated protein n=1 Tax=freshwater metagenome TaxID=449393 RepID=A0A6J6AV29_9ZZZZ|nr:hypothetical protein [Actinomycetota bacterium]
MRIPFGALLALVALSGLLAACGDGRPAFCTPLSQAADLGGISAALRAGDIAEAGDEAIQLRELASEAPPEIRADFEEVADSIIEIIDLVASEGEDGQSDPSRFERRREELNTRLGQIDNRSQRISVWATEQCGLEL